MSVPVIETADLVLRPFVATDAAALFAYASAPEFAQFVEYDPPATLAEAQAFLQAVLMSDDPDLFTWAICLPSDPAVVGTVQLSRDRWDSLSVHYDISHTLYGRGYSTAALQAVLRWALVHLPKVNNFWGDTMAANIGSRRVLEKCGFTLYNTTTEKWAKFPAPVPLVIYRATRSTLQQQPWAPAPLTAS